MKLARPTRDRLIAAGASLCIVLIAFGIVFAAKSCNQCTVTYYLGEEIVRTEKLKKGEAASFQTPKEVPNGKIFDCWVTKDGTQYNFGLPVNEDLALYAKFKE